MRVLSKFGLAVLVLLLTGLPGQVLGEVMKCPAPENLASLMASQDFKIIYNSAESTAASDVTRLTEVAFHKPLGNIPKPGGGKTDMSVTFSCRYETSPGNLFSIGKGGFTFCKTGSGKWLLKIGGYRCLSRTLCSAICK